MRDGLEECRGALRRIAELARKHEEAGDAGALFLDMRLAAEATLRDLDAGVADLAACTAARERISLLASDAMRLIKAM